MVSAFISGLSGPGSSPGQGHCVVFLSDFNLTVPLFIQGNKWVLVNYRVNAGGNTVMDYVASHPGRITNTPSCFIPFKSE